MVLLVYSALPSVSVYVGEFVNQHGVFLVEGSAVESLDGGEGFFGGGVFDEGKARQLK
jgi:hypothetical protein